ncbi:MAG: serine dehydratase subunit alpha family protein [Treponema sp.]|nr:serine dehydratase subunit alpha family protein [Treponema sp.]
MQKDDQKYSAYIKILNEELIPAMGCTEPIALSLAAAKARETLGALPERVSVGASGSVIKNVKSVVVPHTNHLRGIPAAAAAGIIAGNPARELEVIADVSDEQCAAIAQFLETTPISVSHIDNGITFDIIVTVHAGASYATVRIAHYHTNIVLIEKDGKRTVDIPVSEEGDEGLTDRSLLDIESIYDFAQTVALADVRDLIARQISYNTAIAAEGLCGAYGSSIGKLLLASGRTDVHTRAKAKAAAGSDARMNGCELPVVINSGSGNQGITCSVPVIEYAAEYHKSEEELYRALVLSNLVAIHQKTGIGRLSAYCGAVSAGTGAGAGIAYLLGAGIEDIAHTISNSLAIASGMICDGAKASCAAKIAESVDAGILGYTMSTHKKNFLPGDGIVGRTVEATIANVGRLAQDGMHQTNEEIIKIMVEQ